MDTGKGKRIAQNRQTQNRKKKIKKKNHGAQSLWGLCRVLHGTLPLLQDEFLQISRTIHIRSRRTFIDACSVQLQGTMRIATAVPLLVALLGASSVEGRTIARSTGRKSFPTQQQQQQHLSQLQRLSQVSPWYRCWRRPLDDDPCVVSCIRCREQRLRWFSMRRIASVREAASRPCPSLMLPSHST